jgi:hypothetical protein
MSDYSRALDARVTPAQIKQAVTRSDPNGGSFIQIESGEEGITDEIVNDDLVGHLVKYIEYGGGVWSDIFGDKDLDSNTLPLIEGIAIPPDTLVTINFK